MIVKINKSGMVLIPKIVRDTLGIQPDTKINLEIIEDKIIITKIEEKKEEE